MQESPSIAEPRTLFSTCFIIALGPQDEHIQFIVAPTHFLEMFREFLCLMNVASPHEVGLIYDEVATPPRQPDLARDGPRGTN
jgi:hypothetical protein